jgi:hypothetical protein
VSILLNQRKISQSISFNILKYKSEDGKIYNAYTIKFIEQQINDTISPNNFDVIEEIKKNLSKN